MAQPRRKQRLGGIEAAQIGETLSGRGWQLIRERLERTLRLKVDELVAPHAEAETATIRGYIGGLKLALEVPGILLREAKEAVKDGTSDAV